VEPTDMLNFDPESGTVDLPDPLEFPDIVSDGVLVVDSEWRCRVVKAALEALLRRNGDDLLGACRTPASGWMKGRERESSSRSSPPRDMARHGIRPDDRARRA